MKKLVLLFALVFTITCVAAACAENAAGQDITAGDIITFGTYEQDNNMDNGPEPIEWIVLEVRDGKAMLLSKYGLDCIKYHSKLDKVTWEKCSLRAWLNKDFLETAFSENERAAILVTDVDNSDLQGYSRSFANDGNDTKDQVFLLSFYEAFGAYFTTDEERLCLPTDYAIAKKAFKGKNQIDGRPVGCWFLRTAGTYQADVSYVNYYGKLIKSGEVNTTWFMVRPAMWIDLALIP